MESLGEPSKCVASVKTFVIGDGGGVGGVGGCGALRLEFESENVVRPLA